MILFLREGREMKFLMTLWMERKRRGARKKNQLTVVGSPKLPKIGKGRQARRRKGERRSFQNDKNRQKNKWKGKKDSQAQRKQRMKLRRKQSRRSLKNK